MSFERRVSISQALVSAAVPLIVLLLLMVLRPLPAQSVYGSVYGTVYDSSHAVVPNATISVTNVQKGITAQGKSNAAGGYEIDHLIPNAYTVSVTAPGFKTFTLTGVQINAGDSPRVDATLSVGAESQSVTVTSDAEALLETQSQQVAVTIPQNQVQDLPIYTEETSNIIMLVPGTQSLFGVAKVSGEYPTGGGLYSIDGQTTGNLDYTLDGIDNTSPILDIVVVDPPPDTLQAAKIVTGNMDTDVGKAMSAAVELETKSGGNSFHGEVNDFRTSGANLARNPYLAGQAAPHPLPAALSNRFEGNVGGPILRNRLFFFFDYFGQREKVGGTITTTVPSKLEHDTCLGLAQTSTGTAGCDFSDYLAYDNPKAPNAGQLYNNSSGSPVPYTNNVIPNGDLSQQAINMLQLLPYPNTTGTGPGGLTNNYSANGTGVTNSGQYTVRIDDQLTQKMHAFGRIAYFHDNLNGSPIFGSVLGGAGPSGIGNRATGNDQNDVLGLDDAIKDNLLTDIRLGYYKLGEKNLKYDQGTNLATNLGVPGLNGTGYALVDGAPSFTLNGPGGSSLGFGNNCNCELIETEEQFQIVNNWTRTWKTHTVKWGVDLRYGRNLRVPSDQNRSGVLTFGAGPTTNGSGVGGLGFATFMLGDVTQFGRYVSKTSNAKEFQKRTFFYGMDSWRVTPKLTANYGLRWEIYFPETINSPGNGSELNLNTGLMQVAGVGPVPSNMGYDDVLTNFAPRLGLSYQLDNKTVIRAGYGRAFGMGVYGTIFGHSATQNIPALANQQINPSSNIATVFTLSQGPPAFVFPTVDTTTGTVALPNHVTASSRPNPLRYQTLDSWNLSVQRAFTGTLTVTAAYVGNKGTHTWAGNFEYANPNPPFNVLPASMNPTGQALAWDPLYTSSYIAANGGPISPQYPDIGANGHTANIFRLLPYNWKYGWTQPINYYCNCSDTHYNALQFTVDKRVSHGLSLTATYSFQHAYNYDSPYYLADKKIEYGPQDLTRTSVLTLFGYYQLPFGRGADLFSSAPKWADELIGGWRLSPNLNISSGLPFSLNYEECAANLPPASAQQAGASGAPCWPNRSGSLPVGLGTFNPVTHTRQYFNAYSAPLSASNPTEGAFSFPTLDQIGTSGRNPFRGPGFWNVDMSLMKDFPIRENLQGQFRMDAYNAFNHMAAGNPGSLFAPQCIDCGGFNGYITGLATGSLPRQLDFVAKITF